MTCILWDMSCFGCKSILAISTARTTTFDVIDECGSDRVGTANE
jgi:hypothetical protein